MFELTPRDVRRFWSKVKRGRKNQCWPWVAKARHWMGYGYFKLVNGKPGGRNVVASRVACFLKHGPAPDGKPFALHTCDDTGCCNGEHLYWGTQRDNIHDAMRRGRHKKPPVGLRGKNVRH